MVVGLSHPYGISRYGSGDDQVQGHSGREAAKARSRSISLVVLSWVRLGRGENALKQGNIKDCIKRRVKR